MICAFVSYASFALGLTLGFGESSLSASPPKVIYAWSGNKNFLARIQSGLGVESDAIATVYVFAPKENRFRKTGVQELANKALPQEVVITNDGQYLLTIGDHSGGDNWSAAVGIYNLEDGKRKVFALDQIFPKEEIGTISTKRLPHLQYWFDFTSIHVDEANYSVHLDHRPNNKNNKGNTHHSSEIIIDMQAMDVKVRGPDKWKQAYNELQQKHDSWHSLYFDPTVLEFQIFNALKSVAKAPETEYRHAGEHNLYRLELGTKNDTARVLKFWYQPETGMLERKGIISLANNIAPADWKVSPDGKFLLTFDDIRHFGNSDNTIGIYNLEDGIKQIFSLSHICSDRDRQQMSTVQEIFLWRLPTGPWVTFENEEYIEWSFFHGNVEGLIPHWKIDLEKMEVIIAEPFVSEFKGKVRPNR